VTEDPLAQTLVDLRKQLAEHRSIAADHRIKVTEHQVAAVTEDAAAGRLERAIAAMEEPGVTEARVVEPPSGRESVRSMLLRLLNEEDRDWSTAEILAEYSRRGTPIHGKDPNNALRAALAEAKKAAQIVSTGVGRYRAIKWAVEQGARDASADPLGRPFVDPNPGFTRPMHPAEAAMET